MTRLQQVTKGFTPGEVDRPERCILECSRQSGSTLNVSDFSFYQLSLWSVFPPETEKALPRPDNRNTNHAVLTEKQVGGGHPPGPTRVRQSPGRVSIRQTDPTVLAFLPVLVVPAAPRSLCSHSSEPFLGRVPKVLSTPPWCSCPRVDGGSRCRAVWRRRRHHGRDSRGEDDAVRRWRRRTSAPPRWPRRDP